MPDNDIPANLNELDQPTEANGDRGGAPGIAAHGNLFIQLHEASGDGLNIDLSGTEGFVLGRSDSKSSYRPDVDLAAFNALEKGVSRRHAALVRYQGLLHVLDLSSVNGTFLNGSRLTPEQLYALSPGDKVTLGELHLFLGPAQD